MGSSSWSLQPTSYWQLVGSTSENRRWYVPDLYRRYEERLQSQDQWSQPRASCRSLQPAGDWQLVGSTRTSSNPRIHQDFQRVPSVFRFSPRRRWKGQDRWPRTNTYFGCLQPTSYRQLVGSSRKDPNPRNHYGFVWKLPGLLGYDERAKPINKYYMTFVSINF